MQYLFVGGSRNGQRIQLDSHPSYVALPVERFDPINHDQTTEFGPDVEHEFYKVSFINAENSELSVYALQGMSPADVVKALIDSYPQPKADS